MNLEEFAKTAGVELFDCDAEMWGGPVGYKTEDAPNVGMCGYANQQAAYQAWLENSFGERLSIAVLDLLSESK